MPCLLLPISFIFLKLFSSTLQSHHACISNPPRLSCYSSCQHFYTLSVDFLHGRWRFRTIVFHYPFPYKQISFQTRYFKFLVKSCLVFILLWKAIWLHFFPLLFVLSIAMFPPFYQLFIFYCYNFFLHSPKHSKTLWNQLSFSNSWYSVTHLPAPAGTSSPAGLVWESQLHLPSVSRPHYSELARADPSSSWARLCPLRRMENELKWNLPFTDLIHKTL